VGSFAAAEALAQLHGPGEDTASIEMKTLLVPPAGAAAEALTGRPSPTWSVRESYLVDTPSLDLIRAGVEIRLRRRARGRFDLCVSTRRSGITRPPTIPRGARVEYDVVPGTVWQDIEVRREIDRGAAAAVIAGSAESRQLLSPSQQAWACGGGSESVDEDLLKELLVHGPLVVRRVKVAAAEGLSRADLEHFRFPSGRELLELSTRCCPPEARATAAAFEQLIHERDVTCAGDYVQKTSVWKDEVGYHSGR
jgi:hypothetical protein